MIALERGTAEAIVQAAARVDQRLLPNPGGVGESRAGHERVMFSADYPFESVDVAAEFIDHVHLKDDVRADICDDVARLDGRHKPPPEVRFVTLS